MMVKYEAPKMKFEELTFFERIAQVCWGGKTVTFDYPYDDEHNDPTTPDPIPGSFTLESGCGNQTSSVDSWIKANLTTDEYNYWVTTDVNHSSNLANTQAKGITVRNS